jgi:hypothetical protein
MEILRRHSNMFAFNADEDYKCYLFLTRIKPERTTIPSTFYAAFLYCHLF